MGLVVTETNRQFLGIFQPPATAEQTERACPAGEMVAHTFTKIFKGKVQVPQIVSSDFPLFMKTNKKYFGLQSICLMLFIIIVMHLQKISFSLLNDCYVLPAFIKLSFKSFKKSPKNA